MVGLGTVINCGGILAGGLIGLLFGRFFKAALQEALMKVCGVSVLFIAIAGALEGMLQVQGSGVVSGNSLLIVGCLIIGTLLGEPLGIEQGFERFGQWLKLKTGNASDKGLIL